MKRICIFLLGLALSAALCLPARAGLEEDALCLADTLMEGRGHAMRGAVEASSYLLRRFRSMGMPASIQSFTTNKGVGRNIIVVHKGDPRSDKFILVCAHYDGLGVINGTVYPGADNNASGTAVLLYLAEELRNSGKNFVFAALDAHSEGLAGAETMAASLKWKLSMVVNLETMGCTLAPPNKYRPDYLIALGAKKMEKQFESVNQPTGLRIYYDYYRSKSFTEYFYTKISDQAPFLRKGIPAVMFTSGITMNTNKPEDSAETLDLAILRKRAEFIRNWLLS